MQKGKPKMTIGLSESDNFLIGQNRCATAMAGHRAAILFNRNFQG
jgi:hypothetical protein